MRLAPLLFALSACSPGIGVHVSDSAPSALIDATEIAVNRTNDAIGLDLLYLDVSVNSNFGYLDLFSVVVEAKTQVSGDIDNNAYTRAMGAINHVGVEHDKIHILPPETLEWLITHELGHVLGLTHTNSKNNLMSDEAVIGRESYYLTRKQKRRMRAIAGIESIL